MCGEGPGEGQLVSAGELVMLQLGVHTEQEARLRGSGGRPCVRREPLSLEVPGLLGGPAPPDPLSGYPSSRVATALVDSSGRGAGIRGLGSVSLRSWLFTEYFDHCWAPASLACFNPLSVGSFMSDSLWPHGL